MWNLNTVKIKELRSRRKIEKKKSHRTARRTVIKIQASGTFLTVQDTYVPLTVKLTSQNWPAYIYNCMQQAIQYTLRASTERFTLQDY